MKFGSWTYDGNEIDLVHMCAENETSSSIIQNGISFADFYPNVEWDVLQGTAIKNLKKYPCCPEPYIDVTFEITIRQLSWKFRFQHTYVQGQSRYHHMSKIQTSFCMTVNQRESTLRR
jgi:hypothetical protein